MAALFLIVLVVAWVAICLPAAARARQRAPIESTALFKRGLELIGPDHHAEFVRTLGRPAARSPAPPRVVADREPGSNRQPVDRRTGAPAAVRRRPSRAPAPIIVHQGRTALLALLAAGVVVSAGLALVRGTW
ncbi:MAG: hypothetical protein M3174_03540, partial [Actinomycetota bacterium]|nr:hypothetical protein [Actinomycetota bacterium]